MSDTNPTDAVRSMYDRGAEHEWQRMDRHPTEFQVTLRALAEHLPPAPAKILDCGGGPGRYAIELARQGYEVTLFDLSPGNLALARQKAAGAGLTLAAFEQGTALDLARFADASFDAVLLMGPLYHLLEEAERRRAVAEASRVLRPGGPLFAVLISRYAGHRWAITFAPELIVEHPDRLQQLMVTGLQPPGPDVEFVSYFSRPEDVPPLFWQSGLEVTTILGLEGLASRAEERLNELRGPAWEAWLDVNYAVAADPAIHGLTDHLLVVARKPAWRAALRRLAGRLNEAGIPYKVVGSASLALHGLPLIVGDIDIETSAADAYRVADLFADHLVMPVALRESPLYRSHLGHLEIAGVTVEIMGDIEQPVAGGWASTATSTETRVNLDGVPVPVSWLEEEMLAYIRRDRLDRAALCLSHCDQGRLLMLLRGQVRTNVV